MTTFENLGIAPVVLEVLAQIGYITPTPIQEKSIPVALAQRDLLASAQTGSGKTVAFAIPLVVHLLNNPGASALVLTPTRELAMQVSGVMKRLLSSQPEVRMALLIGGDPMMPQIQQLKTRPRLVVGTPGRVIDHMKRGNLRLHKTDFLVLDEADRMLDMGFGIQLDEILPHLAEKRQTLMFSATMPDKVASLAQRYLNKPETIAVGDSFLPSSNIKQEVLHTTSAQKYQQLTKELDHREGSIIIFVATKRGADTLAGKLTMDMHQAEAMHGDLQQRKRERLIRAFRSKNYRIMVATDVAARGLDIAHVEHVINYDLPRQPEDYVHRIGRTGRAGAEGSALSLLLPEDRRNWAIISRFITGDKNAANDERPMQRRGASAAPRQNRDFRPSHDSRGPDRSRSYDSRPSEGRTFERRSPSDATRPTDAKAPERRSYEQRPQGARPQAGRPFEGRSSEGRNDFRQDRDSRGGFPSQNNEPRRFRKPSRTPSRSSRVA